MESQAIVMLGFFAMMAIIVIATTMADYKSKARKKDAPPAPPPAFTSLSLLAGLSFFSGLGAILLAAVAGIMTLAGSMSEVVPMTDSTRRQVDLAARIVLYLSLLPAVGAAAFGLAGRGVIAESRGTVRGKPLYRTGLLLAVITAVVVFDAKILNPANWVTVASHAIAEPEVKADRGFLGVEPGPLDSQGFIPLVRVIPGSPADRAGLKAGDLIEMVDGMRVYQLPPTGNPGSGAYSPGSTENYLGNYIGSLTAGTRVSLKVRRGSQTLPIVAELALSFDSLLKLVRSQSFDEERMAVLKAAGAERRYSTSELRQICAAFDRDEDRLKVIEAALPRLQDPQNAYQILGTLEWSDSKTRVSGLIEAVRKQE